MITADVALLLVCLHSYSDMRPHSLRDTFKPGGSVCNTIQTLMHASQCSLPLLPVYFPHPEVLHRKSRMTRTCPCW